MPATMTMSMPTVGGVKGSLKSALHLVPPSPLLPCTPEVEEAAARRLRAAAPPTADAKSVTVVADPTTEEAQKTRAVPSITPVAARRMTPGSTVSKSPSVFERLKKSLTPKAPANSTPAPRPAGEAAILGWLDSAGLGRVHGLLEAVLLVASDLASLRDVPARELDEAIAPLKLKTKGLKYKKLQSALAVLKGEEAIAFVPKRLAEPEWRDGDLERPLVAPLDWDSSVTRVGMDQMPPPLRPRIGDLRMPANANPLRFKGRTGTDGDGAGAALAGPMTEANELAELASLFGGAGTRQSMRPEHAAIAGKAAEAAVKAAVSAAQDRYAQPLPPPPQMTSLDTAVAAAAAKSGKGKRATKKSKKASARAAVATAQPASTALVSSDASAVVIGDELLKLDLQVALEMAAESKPAAKVYGSESERLAADGAGEAKPLKKGKSATTRTARGKGNKSSRKVRAVSARGVKSERLARKAKAKKGGGLAFTESVVCAGARVKAKFTESTVTAGGRLAKFSEDTRTVGERRQQKFGEGTVAAGTRAAKKLGEDAACAGDRHTKLGEDAQCAGDRRLKLTEDAACAGDRHTKLGEDAQCAGDRRLKLTEDAACAGDRHVKLGEDAQCAGERKPSKFTEETQAAGSRKTRFGEATKAVGERPKLRFTEETKAAGETAGVNFAEDTKAAGERPKARFTEETQAAGSRKTRFGEEAKAIGDRPKAKFSEDTKVAGQRKPLGLRSDNVPCVGEKLAKPQPEEKTLPAEKVGARWLADKIAKAGLEVGAHLEQLVAHKSPARRQAKQRALVKMTGMR